MKYLLLSLLLVAGCDKSPSSSPCDPISQPAPHYGAKNGKCYKSCGALGGEKAVGSEISCTDKGMTDAGTAYDTPYCCIPRDVEPSPTPTPQPTASPEPDETPKDNASGPGRAPPNELGTVNAVNAKFPGSIRACRAYGGSPANEFLTLTVRELQKKNKRWGFMKKPGGKIPRDILAYAWGPEREGTHNFFVIDFVVAGCNNTPGDATFEDPAPDAHPAWQLTNLETATADNGTWSFNP